jgi:OOP family OmpA-OmpF porin
MLPRPSLLPTGAALLGAALGFAHTARAQVARASELPPATSPEARTVELGLFGGLFFPSERHELYDPSLEHRRLESPAPDLGVRAAFFPLRYLGAEIEGALLPVSIDGGGSGTGYAARGHLVLQYPARISPFALVGGGALGLGSSRDELGDDTDGAFHWGLGAKVYLTDLFSVRLEGRHLVGPSLDDTAAGEDPSITSHFELLAGVGLTFPREEREDEDPDQDGIRGLADACPERAGAPPDGCPRLDTDGDGVEDRDDLCPNVRGELDNGCPPRDADEDGVPDGEDACPEAAGSATAGGCPDGDDDGVADADDACPERSGEEPSGCPSEDPDGDGVLGDADACPAVEGLAPHGCPDGDEDGVPDARDDCPTEAETDNDYEDDDGCPDEVPEEVERFTGTIDGIRFASGSAEIRRRSFRVLDRAVRVLRKYPSVRMEIDGHTDNTGDHDANVELSRARAEAVKSYLVSKGIDAERLKAKGFGPDRPVDTNKTRAGRAKNRRIEFRLIQ